MKPLALAKAMNTGAKGKDAKKQSANEKSADAEDAGPGVGMVELSRARGVKGVERRVSLGKGSAGRKGGLVKVAARKGVTPLKGLTPLKGAERKGGLTQVRDTQEEEGGQGPGGEEEEEETTSSSSESSSSSEAGAGAEADVDHMAEELELEMSGQEDSGDGDEGGDVGQSGEEGGGGSGSEGGREEAQILKSPIYSDLKSLMY
jgi:hypothetical protein